MKPNHSNVAHRRVKFPDAPDSALANFPIAAYEYGSCEEVVGRLQDFEENSDSLHLTFDYELILKFQTRGALNRTKKILNRLRGNVIAILMLDDSDGIRIRKITR